MSTIKSISRTTNTEKPTVVVNVKINDEVLPLFIPATKWDTIKIANSLKNPDGSMLDDGSLTDSKINLIDYKIVRKDEEWYSAFRDERGKYKEDKIITTSTITIELNPEMLVTPMKNKMLLKFMNDGMEDKIQKQLEDSLSHLF